MAPVEKRGPQASNGTYKADAAHHHGIRPVIARMGRVMHPPHL